MTATRNELLARMFSVGVQLERYTPHSRNVRGGWRISEGGITPEFANATYRPVGQVENWLQLAMAKDAGSDIWWAGVCNMNGKMKPDDWNFPAPLRYSIGYPVGEVKGVVEPEASEVMSRSVENAFLRIMAARGVQMEVRDSTDDWMPHTDAIIDSRQWMYRPVGQVENWRELALAKEALQDIHWRTAGTTEQWNLLQLWDWNFSPINEYRIIESAVSVPPTTTIGGKIHDAIELLNRHGYVVTRSPS